VNEIVELNRNYKLIDGYIKKWKCLLKRTNTELEKENIDKCGKDESKSMRKRNGIYQLSKLKLI